MQRDEKIEAFRALHHGPRILVLPNAWDVASARIFEDAGCAAIGTSSAGVAFALGYADGQHIPRDEMLEVVQRIARAVSVPVTADVEAGYGDAVSTARAVVQSGAVGMNLEDVNHHSKGDAAAALLPIDKQVRHIHDIRAATDLVINARTDIFLLGIGEANTRFERAVERLNAYVHAGADCAFAPGVRDAETIEKLTRDVLGPLNILAVAGSPSIDELERMDVARVSVGSGPMRATLAVLRRIAEELHHRGGFEILRDAIPYADLNALLGGK
jgi:2-methylisocitrate lyase-like PEP mutase family enzyme